MLATGIFGKANRKGSVNNYTLYRIIQHLWMLLKGRDIRSRSDVRARSSLKPLIIFLRDICAQIILLPNVSFTLTGWALSAKVVKLQSLPQFHE